MQLPLRRRFVTAFLALVWLAAIGAGVRVLFSYESAAGDAGAPPLAWPDKSSLARSGAKANLIMSVHPKCPCSRASIDDLAVLMAHAQGKLTAQVLFLQPDGAGEDWVKTDLWRQAEAIPGVSVFSDRNGAEAEHFQVATSGHTLVYDAAGRLLFSGGITDSRGHGGENVGNSSILALLAGQPEARSRTLVFGCSLFGRRD